MSRVVRQSSYRHVFASTPPKERVQENVKISASAWDTNLISASSKYLAINYQTSGGGAFLITPVDHTGKLPDLFPLCRAHSAPVLDTDWSPFNDSLVASAGEDGRVAVTLVDEAHILEALSAESTEVKDLEPMHKFAGHGRKAGHVKWHPTADGILASASTEVKIWDVGAEQAVSTSEVHSDMVQSLSWDYCGTTYATTCKDKKLRLFDPRAGPNAVVVADSHSGIKGSRVEWLGSLDRIVTTGFSKTSERQVYLWDSRDLHKGPIKSLTIDQSSGTLMPFWNAGSNMLFVAGKGDGNIRYYEYENDELFYLTEYSSPTPQRGMCFLPPRSLNVGDCEIARAFKCAGTMVEPLSFIVPRKSDAFQSDLYPPAPSSKASLSSTEWLSGKNATPILIDLETKAESSAPVTVFAPVTRAALPPTPVASAPAPTPASAPVSAPAPIQKATPTPIVIDTPSPVAAPTPTPAPAPTPAPVVVATPSPISNGNEAEIKALKEENSKLKAALSVQEASVAERDGLIRSLELKLEKIRSAMS